MEKFWFCYVDGKEAPTKRHLYKTEAVAEAGRLFNMERRRVYVLEVVGHHDIVASAFTDITKPPQAAVTKPPHGINLTDNELALAKSVGQLIPAIKAVRQRLHCGLQEAKDACEWAMDNR